MLVFRVWHGASKQLAGAATDRNLHYKVAVKAKIVSIKPANAFRHGNQHPEKQQQQQQQQEGPGPAAPRKPAGDKQRAQEDKQQLPAGTT
uniref:Uncharacterized protein n=1 Tax=Tetradesmus obliquus TaxID=3088 RepID=A0A383V618_TETOB